jgi:hypothetical protein
MLVPLWGWLVIGFAIAILLALLIWTVVWAPPYLVQRGAASDDAYLKAITDTRTTLVQAVGGFAVFLGVLVGLFTLRHNRQQLRASRLEHSESLAASQQALQATLAFNRESLLKTAALTERGQITDRFSKAIDHLGQGAADEVDLRLGGIYALEQIAKDSPDWQMPVVEVLAAFIRQHASGLPPPEGATIDDQRTALYQLPSDDRWSPLPIDISAAMDVLSRRVRAKGEKRLDFSGVDFRRVYFPANANLEHIDFAGARLQHANLMYARLGGCSFLATDLRGANLKNCDLTSTILALAKLDGALFSEAQLDGANLGGSISAAYMTSPLIS